MWGGGGANFPFPHPATSKIVTALRQCQPKIQTLNPGCTGGTWDVSAITIAKVHPSPIELHVHLHNRINKRTQLLSFALVWLHFSCPFFNPLEVKPKPDVTFLFSGTWRQLHTFVSSFD